MAREPLRINGYLAFVIGICLTIWTCTLVVNAQDAQIRGSFVRDTDKVAADTSARLQTYFDTLLSLKALFSVSGEIDRAQFALFVRELRLAERYPGFRAVQFVRYVRGGAVATFATEVRRRTAGQPGMPPFAVHPLPPPDDQGDHHIIEFNEPMAGNENAFGLDLASMPAQLAAVTEARDSGRIVATGRTVLIQDTADHPGFVVRAPVYRQHMPVDTVEQRRAAFLGVVAIVFRVDHLLSEVLDPALLQHLSLQVIDAGDSERNKDKAAAFAAGGALLFDSHSKGARVLAQRVLVNQVEVAQRQWQLRYSALAGSRYGRDIVPPVLVGLGGLVISALIAALLLASHRGAMLEQRLRAILDEKQASLVELAQQKKHVELAHGDLSSVLITLKQAQANLITSEKLASLGALVAGIAHELNTPIGNSLLTATALADMVADFEKQYTNGGIRRSALEAHLADTRLACSIMASSLGRAADLITSFKQVSVDQTSDQRRRFDLAEVVGDTVATYAAQLRRANCSIDVDIAPRVTLDSYPGGLGQVLSNLINNALLHAFGAAAVAPPHIAISAGEIDGSHIVLRFRDDGVGMSEKTLHQIFDPFFTTKLGQGGSGLGMNIVYNVVTGMLGGTISIESSPGHGTSVTIMMPMVAPRVAPLLVASPAALRQAAATQS
ncbi:CHASE domain-containing protein [Massilia sp. DWR3-1-1]|uniref:CHASE domain-containing protein n=1 Tax=Massilia sp. DWR3-1-1 TaxID=2804559 RepID=UPI003CF96473